MIIHERDESIFDAQVDALVNPVNCVGVMGKGLALEFRKRFPKMYEEYKLRCFRGEVLRGRMDIHGVRGELSPYKLIINFPTKNDWRDQSTYAGINWGLEDLALLIETYPLKSIAVPALGCGLGGLEVPKIENMVRQWIGHLCEVHFYR